MQVDEGSTTRMATDTPKGTHTVPPADEPSAPQMLQEVTLQVGLMGIGWEEVSVQENKGAKIDTIAVGGWAEDAQLAPGMQLLAIDGEEVAQDDFPDILATLQSGVRPVTLRLSLAALQQPQQQPSATLPVAVARGRLSRMKGEAPAAEDAAGPAKKKKKAKEDGEPKGARTNYAFFATAKCAELTAADPELELKIEVPVLLGAAWKELSEEEKAPFAEKAAADKVRYTTEMEAFSQPEA